ncbi:uncharacterized protein LOC133708657 [Rosa rugosa]|uniref:uncharacterized protein LOC133708657 n=1 Tax=Rosa rugosa TaxID=74645 RepID=UPI002B40882A|nr:uncharacterized protein LOC133708657 [Rosa rugosa]
MHTQKRLEDAFGEESEEVDEWGIYKAVIGGPSHGRIRGLGDGMIPLEDEDVDSSSHTCDKHPCMACEKEFKQVNEKVTTSTNQLEDLKQVVMTLLSKNSTHSECATEAPSTGNTTGTSGANHEDK